METAKLRSPEGIAIDKYGNLYITEYRSSIVRKISSDGIVTTLAGKEMELGADDGTGLEARFNRPHGIAVDNDLNVYVTDMKNCTVRKITPEGVVSTHAGIPGVQGAKNGLASESTFYFPEDIAVNSKGDLFVADSYNFTIRKISSDGVVSTYAGKAGEPGSEDGLGAKARFNKPLGIAIDGKDNIYVADSDYDGEPSGNCTIRKISPKGKVTTIAGIAGKAGHVDGSGKKALFHKPVGIDVTPDGIIYVADTEADLIRKIDKKGMVTTIGGKYLEENKKNGIGEEARFKDPQAIAVGKNGILYIADTLNNRIVQGECL